MTSAYRPGRFEPPAHARPRSRARWNAWKLLLLVPLLALFTPLYNRVEPTLYGVPFFYWGQVLGIGLGACCTLLVFSATRRSERTVTDRPDLLDVDHLDEGAMR